MSKTIYLVGKLSCQAANPVVVLIYLLSKSKGLRLDVLYSNSKFEKLCTNRNNLERKYGVKMAEKVFQRIAEIASIDSIDTMLKFKIGQCHALSNNRKGQYSVHLVEPYRLVFKLEDDNKTKVRIIEIVDYH